MTNKLLEIRTERVTSLATTARLDARTLAVLGLYFHKSGENPRSLNELIQLSVEVLRELILASDPTLVVEQTATAVEVLRRLGLGDIRQKNRNVKTLARQLANEQLSIEGLDPLAPVRQEAVCGYSEVDLKRALNEMERVEDPDLRGTLPEGDQLTEDE
ncbi:MAG: hypothetical protein WC954_06765 [Sphaerochaeta sp.]